MLKERLKRVERFGVLGVHPAKLLDPDNEDEEESPLSASDNELKVLIFDIGNMSAIDASAIQTLYEIVEEYQDRGIQVRFVKLQDGCVPMFLRSGLFEIVGVDCFFTKIVLALRGIVHGDVEDRFEDDLSFPIEDGYQDHHRQDESSMLVNI